MEYVLTTVTEKVRRRLPQRIDRARAERGKDQQDQQLTEAEAARAIDAWDESPSLPADLIPRSAYMHRGTIYRKVAWPLVKWSGPGALAIRPARWQHSVLLGIYKKGDKRVTANFRMIFVRIQLALVQKKFFVTASGTASGHTSNKVKAGMCGVSRIPTYFCQSSSLWGYTMVSLLSLVSAIACAPSSARGGRT